MLRPNFGIAMHFGTSQELLSPGCNVSFATSSHMNLGEMRSRIARALCATEIDKSKYYNCIPHRSYSNLKYFTLCVACSFDDADTLSLASDYITFFASFFTHKK